MLRLWKATRAIATAAIATRGRQMTAASTIIDTPIAQITWANTPSRKSVVKYQATVGRRRRTRHWP